MRGKVKWLVEMRGYDNDDDDDDDDEDEEDGDLISCVVSSWS